MLGHIAVVHQSAIASMGDGSVFQIGDTNQMNLRSKFVAVHREIPTFFDIEGEFEGFPMFLDDQITIPTRTTSVKMNIINQNPFIEVDCVTMYTMLNAACFHIGSVEYVFSNARVKQMRQFITEEPSEK